MELEEHFQRDGADAGDYPPWASGDGVDACWMDVCPGADCEADPDGVDAFEL